MTPGHRRRHDEVTSGNPHAGATAWARRLWARPLWLAAAVLATAVVAALVRGLDDDLSVDELYGRQPADATQLTDPKRWTLHRNLDDAQAIAPAPDGGVWVTTPAGLVRWEADGEDRRRYRAEQLDGRYVGSLMAAGDGTVWALTERRHGDPGGDSPGDPPERATQLLRFDGSQWATASNGSGWPGGEPTALAVDADGAVWAATDQALARFHDGAWHAHTPFAEAGLTHERSITVDSSGAVWVTAASADGYIQGVARFTDGAWRAWSSDDGLPRGEIDSLATGGGRAWMLLRGRRAPADDPDPATTAYRLFAFDGRGWAIQQMGDGETWESLGELTVDSQGTPWAVSRRRRVDDARLRRVIVRFDGTAWRRVGADELARGGVSGLTAGPDGAVWVGLRSARFGDGSARVGRFDGDAWTVYGSDDGLPRTTSLRVTAGRQASWVVSDNGVARFDGDGWTRFATREGIASASVADVVTDDDGAVWAATARGVSRLADGAWTTWTTADGLTANVVTSLATGPDGDVWAGTYRGVSRFDGQEWTAWTDALGGLGVESLSVGDDGTVWAVTSGRPSRPGPAPHGLARYRDGEWTTWAGEDLVGDRTPVDVAAGEHGGVWVAVRGGRSGEAGPDTASGGVAHFDGRRWEVATADDGLPTGDVNAVAVADSGAVWAGTHRGVARFRGDRWVSADTAGNPLGLDEHDPVADGDVRAVAPGPGGGVWAVTRRGLSRFDGDDWTNLAAAQLPAHPGYTIAVGRQAVWVVTRDALASIDRWRD